VKCDAPSPRASSTLIGSPSNHNELLLFGGEYFNGALATFYNDLFIYLIDRDEWRKVTSPNSPLSRSGHAWCRGGNAGGVYLFGGEISARKPHRKYTILIRLFKASSHPRNRGPFTTTMISGG
jgi:hypothetical protein